MTEASLKPGWRKWRFDQIATNVNERIDNPSESDLEYYVGLEHIDPDSLKLRRWGSPSDVEATKLIFRKGDIIFGRRRVYQRKVAIAEFDGICSAHALVLRANPEVVLPDFLPFFMQSNLFMERAKAISVGSLSPTINWRTLAKEEFALPSITEQNKISEVLCLLFDNLQRNQEFKASSKVVAQSFTDSVFDLIVVKKLLRREATLKELKLVKLGDLCSLQVGYPFKSSEYSNSGDKLLRCSNVGIGDLEWSPDETKFWPSERRDEFHDYILSEGDIVVAMDRPFVSDGFKVSIVRETDLPALLLQRVGRFQISKKINKDFLWCFLHSTSLHLQLLAQQQGTDIPHISKFDIERTVIPDISLEEQQELGNKYLELSSASREINNRISVLQKMKTELLKEALG